VISHAGNTTADDIIGKDSRVDDTFEPCLDACPRLIEQFLETRRSRDDEALNIIIIIIDRSN